MKFSVISFVCLTSFFAGIHSQNFEPPYSAYLISLENVRSSLHKLWSAIEEYPATYLNHVNVNQSTTAFVDRAQDLVQVFQDGKTITNVSGNMTALDTISVRDHRHVAGFLYFQMTTLLHNRIRKIKNASSCETTRKQLTDINANAHAFIDFLYLEFTQKSSNISRKLGI